MNAICSGCMITSFSEVDSSSCGIKRPALCNFLKKLDDLSALYCLKYSGEIERFTRPWSKNIKPEGSLNDEECLLLLVTI